MGAESGSQFILDAMDKGITVDQIRKATGLLKEKGVKVGYFLQFGYLGETRKEINETIKLATEMLPDEIGISVSYPLKGTGFYEKVRGDSLVKENWNDSDYMKPLHFSTYSKSFYPKLQKYVHYRYRIQKIISELRILNFSRLSDLRFYKNLLKLSYYTFRISIGNIQLAWLQSR
jgi:anaerobic magnesium-protoporphyrin IX monomethyl ester cyclase